MKAEHIKKLFGCDWIDFELVGTSLHSICSKCKRKTMNPFLKTNLSVIIEKCEKFYKEHKGCK